MYVWLSERCIRCLHEMLGVLTVTLTRARIIQFPSPIPIIRHTHLFASSTYYSSSLLRCSHSDMLGFQPSYSFAPNKNKNKNKFATFSLQDDCRVEELIPLSAMTTKLIVSLTLQ